MNRLAHERLECLAFFSWREKKNKNTTKTSAEEWPLQSPSSEPPCHAGHVVRCAQDDDLGNSSQHKQPAFRCPYLFLLTKTGAFCRPFSTRVVFNGGGMTNDHLDGPPGRVPLGIKHPSQRFSTLNAFAISLQAPVTNPCSSIPGFKPVCGAGMPELSFSRSCRVLTHVAARCIVLGKLMDISFKLRTWL